MRRTVQQVYRRDVQRRSHMNRYCTYCSYGGETWTAYLVTAVRNYN